MKKVVLFLILFLYTTSYSFAGIFSMSSPPAANQEVKQEAISVLDEVDKIFNKRLQEARKLITEGNKLIKKGEKKKKGDLIIKGKIKKEIGENQIQSLKEQIENKKTRDERSNW
ncbi:MAG: hypothetical protein HYY52_01615 [Candidatus Melainabacteria bacterium]|nr:hypothetical protein [Candidatus Melainabacteria bacterium]